MILLPQNILNQQKETSLMINKGDLCQFYFYHDVTLSVGINPLYYGCAPNKSVEVAILKNSSMSGHNLLEEILQRGHEETIEGYVDRDKFWTIVSFLQLKFGISNDELNEIHDFSLDYFKENCVVETAEVKTVGQEGCDCFNPNCSYNGASNCGHYF